MKTLNFIHKSLEYCIFNSEFKVSKALKPYNGFDIPFLYRFGLEKQTN